MIVGLSNFAQTMNEWMDTLFLFDETAEVLLLIGIRIWNWSMGIIFQLFQMDLDTFAGGAGMDFVTTLQPVFLSIAAPLFVCFFFYNVYYESFEEKRNTDFWSIIKMFFPLLFGELLLTNSVSVVSYIFKIGFWLVRAITHYEPVNLLVDEATIMQTLQEFGMILENNVLSGLILLLVGFLTMVILVICAGILIYTVYFRFLKLYAVLPFSSLAFCTYSGPQELKRIGWMYAKYISVLALESVAMLIMIILCNAILSSGMPELLKLFPDNGTILLTFIVQCLVIIFNCCLTVGAAKGAEAMLSKFILH